MITTNHNQRSKIQNTILVTSMFSASLFPSSDLMFIYFHSKHNQPLIDKVLTTLKTNYLYVLLNHYVYNMGMRAQNRV